MTPKRKDDFMQRQRKFDMRLTERDFKLLERRAGKCMLTKSAYIGQLLHGYRPREAPPADYFAMKHELCQIGNNLNQLAFMANATGLIDEAAYYENVIQLHDAIRRIEKAVVEFADEEDDEL